MFAACVASVQTYRRTVQKIAKFAFHSIHSRKSCEMEKCMPCCASLISGSLRRAMLAKTQVGVR
eukprot:COSAG04_NODE_12598_length_644_cov_26.043069_1_plen_64_part_00